MLKYNFNTRELEIFSAEDLVRISHFQSKFTQKRSPFLNYNTAWLQQYYHKTCDQGSLLKSADSKLVAPYEILYDYRNTQNADWGSYSYSGEFSLTNELAPVKSAFIELFKKRNLLYKGDNICPRIHEFNISDGKLSIGIQKAHYYDQVATNLSLDYPLTGEDVTNLLAKNLREWDIIQSKTDPGNLPSFQKSKLANTIGVALGITAKNKKNEKIMLIRQRTKNVAVSQNMFVLPFSFSLNLDNKICQSPHSGSIFDLIRTDFRHEQAEELGLEPNIIDFEKVKPVLFCREFCRGGKPQFFFEIDQDIPFEELRMQIRESSATKKEYKGDILGITIKQGINLYKSLSPELNAFIASKC